MGAKAHILFDENGGPRFDDAIRDLGNPSANIPFICLRNLALMEPQARAMAAAISRQTNYLKTVKIIGEILDDTEPGDNRAILYDGIGSSSSIQEIILEEVPPEALEGFGNAVSAMPSLKTLRVKLERLMYESEPSLGELVSAVLMRSSTISTIELKKVYLTDPGFVPLASQGLSHNMSLTSLTLHCCKIGDDSIRMLIDNWPPDSPLRELNFQDNLIGPDGAQLLFRAAANHPALRSLNLMQNEDIGFEGLKKIGEELPAQLFLTDLNISRCCEFVEYEDASCKEAKTQEKARDEARKSLTDGMKRNNSIVKLNLGYSAKLALEPEFYANSVNRMGRYLLSTDHGLASTVWCHILAKYQRQQKFGPSLTYYFLCEQPTLMQPTRKRRWKQA